MATVVDFVEALGREVDPSQAAAWDPVGLQVGDPTATVERVGVCHEISESVLGAVEADPVDLLVAYHPLLFRPVTKLVGGRSPAGRAMRLVAAGVAVVITHTDFDASPGGTADALAAAMDLTERHPFGPLVGADAIKVVTFVPEDHADSVTAAMATAGAGEIGNYSGCSFRSAGTGTFTPGRGAQPTVGEVGRMNQEPEMRVEMVAPRRAEGAVLEALVAAHPYEEPAFDVFDSRSNLGMVGRLGRRERTDLQTLASETGERLEASGVRVAGDPATPIETVAVVPGSGGDLISAAAAAGANVLITGDVSHHRAVDALDRGMAIIDPGHTATERPGMGCLHSLVAKLCDDTVDWTTMDPSPWRTL